LHSNLAVLKTVPETQLSLDFRKIVTHLNITAGQQIGDRLETSDVSALEQEDRYCSANREVLAPASILGNAHPAVWDFFI
jgi:hypothetical protein